MMGILGEERSERIPLVSWMDGFDEVIAEKPVNSLFNGDVRHHGNPI